jgi:uncharacterized protein YecT (DUF1311 family)
LRERNAEVERIKGYVDLTDEAKDRRIREVDERANAAYTEARERQKRGREERLKSTQRSVFNVADASATLSEAERAQIHAAYSTDDTLMAKAAYHRAIDLGLQPIIDRYLADRPKEERAMERYAAAVEVARGDWPQWRAA